MLRNHLKLALRTLRKHPGYASLNVLGLAVGLAACLVLFLYVRDELQYDAHHLHADRIYRVNLKGALSGSFFDTAVTSAPLAFTFVEELPEVEQATRFWQYNNVLVTHEDRRFYEETFSWADSTVFDVFTIPLVAGQGVAQLSEPNTVVLSERAARKYFGAEEPIGKMLRLGDDLELRVTGVMQDAPATSRYQFDFLGAFVTQDLSRNPYWIQNSIHSYVLLRPGADPAALEAKFPALIEKYVAPQVEEALGLPFTEATAAGLVWSYYLDPLPDIYLHSDATDGIGPSSDIAYVYILSAIAFFILLIACINFMNLATARSANRAKEVGVRKVLGSTRTQLIRQFLGESVLTALLALSVALLAVWALLPAFNALAGKALMLFASANVGFLVGILVVALVAGVLAGLYPALVLAAFEPVAVLKGAPGGGARQSWLRNALVVTQFAISILLLVGTGVVFDQLDFLQNRHLGFEGSQVVVLPVESDAGRQGYEAFRNELLAMPGVQQVSTASAVPGRIDNTSAFRPADAPSSANYALAAAYVGYEYLETLGIPLVSGRTFSREVTTDSSGAYLINETAARQMGLAIDEAPGTPFVEVGPTSDNNDYGTIVGVVKDFHFESLHDAIRPMVLVLSPTAWPGVSVMVRVRPEALTQVLPRIRAAWETLEPGYPYRYTFLDDDFARLYEQERRLGRIYSGFTGLAMLIACLGLFGVAAYITQQRTKEIGVRKVLGATAPGLVVLLSKEFTALVLLAMLIAFPLGYLAMHAWLTGFAYHAALSPTVFGLAGGAALVVAWLTISYHTIKAALANPVESLKYE